MSFNKNYFDFGNPITPKINNKIIPIFTLKREIKTASAVFFLRENGIFKKIKLIF